MTDKQQELDLKLTLENLEELFAQLSFDSNYSNLKVLSIETVEEAALKDQGQYKADVIQLEDIRKKLREPVIISKALHFRDNYHR